MIARYELFVEVHSFKSLDEAFRWAIAQTPQVVPVDVVIQDEYTHDVIFRAGNECYLVFDST